ncbi:MAG TPA: phosphatase PAP2 family protein [Steroidobacteraceae bacterium]|nr:phosphatase PAP2 family protein [Steroidobacteraceae bacterium]
MKRFSVVVRIWLLSLAACAVIVAFSFARLDVPLALYFWRLGRSLSPLGQAFGAAVILSVEALVILGLILARLVRGRISPFGEALAIACLTSICAYGINSDVLKPLFGVPSPIALVRGAPHAFKLLMGSAQSSFPSGHMVLAGAFAGVLIRMYRASIAPLSALLLAAAGLLVIGGWHFLSDVVAGAFLGISAGMLAGEIWVVHMGGGPAGSRRQGAGNTD